VSEFKGTNRPSDDDATRATAHLPGLDVEIVHRRSPDGEAEQISINLQAMPSFEAFGRFLESTNPLAFWAEATRLAWRPWLEAAQKSAVLPWDVARSLSKPGAQESLPTTEEPRS
jgi:hypothetical protein